MQYTDNHAQLDKYALLGVTVQNSWLVCRLVPSRVESEFKRTKNWLADLKDVGQFSSQGTSGH